MIPEKVLYTDGHDVVITESTFQVKNKLYSLSGITKHGLQVLRPDRTPAIFIFLVGIIIAVAGILKSIPASWMNDVEIAGRYVSVNTLAIWSGIVIAFLALVVALALRERYAVRIATAEGEKNAVVSKQKEYIRQIVNALNEAYGFLRSHMSGDTSYRTYTTSTD